MGCNCQIKATNRRSLLKFGAAGGAALGLGTALGGPARPARAAEGEPTPLSPGQALAALRSGNQRYVTRPELCVADLAARRRAVANHQAPWATIISCADSRLPPE